MSADDRLELIGHESLGDVDAVLYASNSGHHVAVWTRALPTRREVIGLETRPTRPNLTNLTLVKDWLTPRCQEYAEIPQPEVAPLPASLLRADLSYRRVLADVAARHDWLSSMTRELGEHAVAIEASDGRRVAFTDDEWAELMNGGMDRLVDAAIYTAAVLEGRSPILAIAEFRTISHRTAEGRASRARLAGYLTPPEGRRAAGRLTDRASDLLRRLDIASLTFVAARGD